MPARFHVEITRRAERDIDEIWTFIAQDNLKAADRLVLQLEKQLRTLERFPERSALIPENELLGARYRHLIYGKYRTIFRVTGKTVYVVRVIHAGRLLDTSTLD